MENGWLYFELKANDYFNLIKSMDNIVRLSNMGKVDVDISNVSVELPMTWTVLDNSIVELIVKERIVNVKGLSKGKTAVEYDGIKLEITVK